VIPEQVKHQARIELARRSFWDFEQLLYPELFTDERKLLKEMAETIQTFVEDSDKHYLVLSVPPGHYKALEVTTPVLTTKGWKEHGKLEVGDYVYSDTGKPVKVTEVHPIHKHASMVVKTASGDEIVASERHLWKVYTSRERVKNGKKIARQEEILETKDILKGYHKRRPYIALPPAIENETKELPIDPYTLGVWIGDGYSHAGRICVGEEDLDYFATKYGNYRKESSAYSVKIPVEVKQLRELNLYKNKHIPIEYLLASEEQRLELLRGLMDTDGTVHNKYFRCTFVQTNHHIAQDVMTLCRSLGIKSILRKYQSKQYGTDYYHVSFTTDKEVFKIPRKAARLLEHLNVPKSRNNQATIHAIESITPCGEQTVNCITVEGGMYLAGRGLIPTHNSFTAKNLALWLMGKDPTTRIIGAANSGDLASMFSTQIRDTILGINVGKGGIPYPQIFPDTKIKQGFATKSKWELEGSSEPSYRATSPTSAITGSRADYFIIDDVIKNHTEAMNALALQQHFNWFKNTLFSRADGDNYKFIFVMQRWATNDLSGEVIKLYGDDVVVVSYEIEDKDGNMLEPSIMSRAKFEEAKKTLDPNILKANYYQQPVDIEGRLYTGFQEWTTLPDSPQRYNNTDVADQGKDNLCSINWIKKQDEDGVKVYITDIYYSPEKAEVTEPAVAKMITADQITEAEFESNNGGKGYARNVERELHALQNFKTVVKWTPQTANKEARIMASSAWVAKNVYMPPNWTSKYPEFASEVLSYVAGGKNAHDDGVDVLATIYERAANLQPITYSSVY
jgi:predicted phage terminase large subunit-like protein